MPVPPAIGSDAEARAAKQYSPMERPCAMRDLHCRLPAKRLISLLVFDAQRCLYVTDGPSSARSLIHPARCNTNPAFPILHLACYSHEHTHRIDSHEGLQEGQEANIGLNYAAILARQASPLS